MPVDYKALLSNALDGIYFTDTTRRIIYWNESAERITGYKAQEVVGSRCADNILIHVDEQGRSLCKSNCPLASSLKDKNAREAKVFLQHKQGHRIPVHVRVTPLCDNEGLVIGGAEFFSDISGQEILNERLRELERLALLDTLTELPNRRHLIPELTSRFHEKKRMKLDFGLIFIDIDGFKAINDTYGHSVGDRVLKTVANTLKASVRPFDLVGRWGGDEMVCIVRNVDASSIQTVAQRLLAMIHTSSVSVNGRRIQLSVSIGATVAGTDDDNDTLIQRADSLMYAGKKKGGNQIAYG